MAIAPEITDNSSSPNYNSQLNLIGPLEINEITSTSVSINVSINTLGVTPTLYYVTYQKLLSDGVTPTGSATTITSSSKPIIVTALTAGAYYNFTVSAWVGSTFGNSSSYNGYKMSDATTLGATTGIAIDPKKVTPGKSFYVLSGYNNKQYTVSSRTFSSLVMPTSSSGTFVGENGVVEQITNYAESYYTFGTSFILSPSEKYPFPTAALGFFAGENGSSGYFIMIEPTGSSVTNSRNSLRIVKVEGKQMTTLADIKKSPEATQSAIFAGISYAVDVKVKVLNSQISIVAYVNGFKITATDTTGATTGKPLKRILPPTNRVALAAAKGQVYFDYIYANKLDDPKKFTSSDYDINIYQGQFSNDILSTSFGDIVYDGRYAADEINKKGTALDEFGTTVREILKVDTKFESRPAYPIKWSTGDNKYATVLGYKISNFGGQAYVLNNTSTTIPLSDGDIASFYIYGNTLGLSGQLEYLTDVSSEYAVKEPVQFESKWLQTEADVKSLANWIKDKVINRGRTVSMEIFGNPLLSVGDIITIKYPYNGFAGTEKFIITNVSHSYNEGLTTSIVCRSM